MDQLSEGEPAISISARREAEPQPPQPALSAYEVFVARRTRRVGDEKFSEYGKVLTLAECRGAWREVLGSFCGKKRVSVGSQSGQHAVFSCTRTHTVLQSVYARLVLQLSGSSGPTGHPRKHLSYHKPSSPGEVQRTELHTFYQQLAQEDVVRGRPPPYLAMR